MTLNAEQAKHDNEQVHKEARRHEIRKVLQSAKFPLTVANVVKQTGYRADDVRDVLLDMVAEGEAKERAWMYTL